jgi:hypothetical protein
MDLSGSVFHVRITITIDWKLVLSIGSILLARLLVK